MNPCLFSIPTTTRACDNFQRDDKPTSDNYPNNTIYVSLVYSTDCRMEIGEQGLQHHGYPSSGGVIVRDNADIVELAYLGLDRLNPAEKRLRDQDAEDAYCGRSAGSGGKA
ncbi:hypothetical protein GJ744_009239 [Endocarpon pusillum]|uniref:Uncharacterized protein n=1 Tax=Endocarpon pusillum TaxID=364733 RepID=A0A8H7E6E1_9EURO|nr:hypothetical protein GJ744_009239 [Endocarpon pusillum]